MALVESNSQASRLESQEDLIRRSLWISTPAGKMSFVIWVTIFGRAYAPRILTAAFSGIKVISTKGDSLLS